MSAEDVGGDSVLFYGEGIGVSSASQVQAVRPDVVLKVNDAGVYEGSQQQREDESVIAELRRLVLGRLPDDDSVQVLLCEEPEAAGIPREVLADAMLAAYGKARIGERAEGMDHFEKMFRGYQDHEHGPIRFVIIQDTEGKVWVFCDYFGIDDDYEYLVGAPYASIASQWKEQTGLRPGVHVMSKLVNTHNLATDQRRSRIAAGLGARVFASIVQGLANVNKDGMLLAGNAQAGTRNFVVRRLSSLLTGRLEVLFDNVEEGKDGEAPEAQMVIHVLPTDN